ncbi:MAG: DUF5788 family protein [Methanosarcinaceae archaeon]|nr:DUF5788 family protein [Methanosarcinaceae archaeon]
MPEMELITKRERAKLLNSLYRYVFWVGEKIPEKVEIDGKTIMLHEFIWEMINKTELSDEDKGHIERYITLLSKKEHEYKTYLETAEMTPENAKKIFNKTAGLLRAIMDLKELEKGPRRGEEKHFHQRLVERKVAEAKELIFFMDELKK